MKPFACLDFTSYDDLVVYKHYEASKCMQMSIVTLIIHVLALSEHLSALSLGAWINSHI